MRVTPQASRRFLVRRGLTLIELVVVMVVLIALAGILIPKLTGMVTRAHTSSSATNIGEIAKAIQFYETVNAGYPDRLDSLVTNLTTGDQFTAMAPGTDDLVAGGVTLTADTVETLEHAGIRTVTMMSDTGASSGNFAWSPTFYPYADPTPLTTPATATLATGNILVGLQGAAASREFATPATATYVMFGVGKYSRLSSVMMDAPVHFPEGPDQTPEKSYSRYLAVFQLTDAAGDALEKAVFVGVVALHDDHVSGLGAHMNEYWSTNAGSN